MTYFAMLLVPFSMMGLYALDHQKGGLPLLIGTSLIAIAFIYFAGTALYVFAENQSNYLALIEKLRLSYFYHGILLAVGEVLFFWVGFRRMLYPRYERESASILQATPEMGDIPSCWDVYFSSDDVDASAKAATAAGGNVLREPFDIPNVGARMAVLQDPQGAVFEIIENTG